jgi:hypothetical protein
LSGGAAGVTELDGADGAESPAAVVATTVNVYEVPLVRPVTLHVSAPVVMHVRVPGDDVTVYLVTVAPLPAAAFHDTVASAGPAVAFTSVGAPGFPAGTTTAEAAEGAEVPTSLVAVTRNVYDVPLVRPVTSHESAPPTGEHVFEPGVDVTV